MNGNEHLVSIIVPVYNAALFLRDCLESLLKQGIPSVEILCVNDGSTDESLEILEEYADRYPQIRIVNQKNSGVSAARNTGLALARGRYITFCDSDDYLLTGALEIVVKAAEKNHAQLCFFDEQIVSEYDGYEQNRPACPPPEDILAA